MPRYFGYFLTALHCCALFIAWLFMSALVAQNALVRRSGSGFWHGLWHALLPAMFTALILRAFQIIFLGHNDQTLLSLNARGVNAVHGDPVPPKQMQKKAPPYGIAQAGSLRKFFGKKHFRLSCVFQRKTASAGGQLRPS